MDIQTLSTDILQWVITVAVPAAVGYVAVFLKKHFTAKQIESAQEIASVSVKAAQQLGLTNSEKFQTALTAAKSFASKHGIKYTDEQWQSLIEAAVNEGKQIWNSATCNTTNTDPSSTDSTAQTAQVEALKQASEMIQSANAIIQQATGSSTVESTEAQANV